VYMSNGKKRNATLTANEAFSSSDTSGWESGGGEAEGSYQ
jgi:hypothetical protein